MVSSIVHTKSFPFGSLKIKRILIGHDNIGLRAGWHLAYVQVSIPLHGKLYNFPCNRWLDKNEADGKVEIDVYPSEIEKIEKRKKRCYDFVLVILDRMCCGEKDG